MAKKGWRITTIKEGYGKGTFIVKGPDSRSGKDRTYPSGGLLKTERRAKNWLNKMMGRK